MVPFTQEHEYALAEMRAHCHDTISRGEAEWVTYPNQHLLRLDEKVIHKTDDFHEFQGIRTFVKISVSDHIYALEGNSKNPYLDLGVEYKPRQEQRNCPASHRGK